MNHLEVYGVPAAAATTGVPGLSNGVCPDDDGVSNNVVIMLTSNVHDCCNLKIITCDSYIMCVYV